MAGQSLICFPRTHSVPYTEPRLLGGTSNAASSPWVIAIEHAGYVFIHCIKMSDTDLFDLLQY